MGPYLLFFLFLPGVSGWEMSHFQPETPSLIHNDLAAIRERKELQKCALPFWKSQKNPL